MNTITFLAPSGSLANGTVIAQLSTPGNTSGANHLGFFGIGGPQGSPYAVIVDNYQDRTFITNTSGTNLGVAPWGLTGGGRLDNAKYASSNTVNMNGYGAVALSTVPFSSGTLLVRFVPSGAIAVTTQGAILRCVALNAASGVDDVSTVVTGLKVQAFEPGVSTTWTQLAGTGATDNQLLFADHLGSDIVHDFFVGLSASPEAVGARNNFGFLMVVEFL